jgi:hypothetical protein
MLLLLVPSLFAAPSLLLPVSFRYALLRGGLLIGCAHVCLRVQTTPPLLFCVLLLMPFPSKFHGKSSQIPCLPLFILLFLIHCCVLLSSLPVASISFRDLLYALHNSYCSSQNFYKRMSFNYYLNTFPSRHQNSTRQITILWSYMLLPHPLQ